MNEWMNEWMNGTELSYGEKTLSWSLLNTVVHVDWCTSMDDANDGWCWCCWHGCSTQVIRWRKPLC
jgi:hypothetical protein